MYCLKCHILKKQYQIKGNLHSSYLLHADTHTAIQISYRFRNIGTQTLLSQRAEQQFVGTHCISV